MGVCSRWVHHMKLIIKTNTNIQSWELCVQWSKLTFISTNKAYNSKLRGINYIWCKIDFCYSCVLVEVKPNMFFFLFFLPPSGSDHSPRAVQVHPGRGQQGAGGHSGHPGWGAEDRPEQRHQAERSKPLHHHHTWEHRQQMGKGGLQPVLSNQILIKS